MIEFFTHSFETKIKNKMELQLHEVSFFFYDEKHFYKVMCVAFEDNSFSVFIFEVTEHGNIIKRIAAIDAEQEPTSKDAKEFLTKALNR